MMIVLLVLGSPGYCIKACHSLALFRFNVQSIPPVHCSLLLAGGEGFQGIKCHVCDGMVKG